MIGFRIIQAGMFSTFQEVDRRLHQDKGVPVSGSMDLESHYIANVLVGKNQSDAVLEMTASGATIHFEKVMVIAITGGDMSALLNGLKIPMYESIVISKNDVLTFGTLISGFRTYIAFSDTLFLDRVMDSQSTYTGLGIGGYKGRNLKKGDVIEVRSRVLPPLKRWPKKAVDKGVIHFIEAYESDFFDLQTMVSHTYTISDQSNRMGIRLKGGQLHSKQAYDIISAPIMPGTIQVPGSGEPIIAMRDCQTIGGYTRIGHILFSDINKLAQLKPGDEIRFKLINLASAKKIKQTWLKDMLQVDGHCVPIKVFKINVNKTNYYTSVEEKL